MFSLILFFVFVNIIIINSFEIIMENHFYLLYDCIFMFTLTKVTIFKNNDIPK